MYPAASAKYRAPDDVRYRPSGLYTDEDVAGPPSELVAPVPVPTRVATRPVVDPRMNTL